MGRVEKDSTLHQRFASVDATAQDTTKTEDLVFTFHGDTTIDPPPQTYEDALEVYRSLPTKVSFKL